MKIIDAKKTGTLTIAEKTALIRGEFRNRKLRLWSSAMWSQPMRKKKKKKKKKKRNWSHGTAIEFTKEGKTYNERLMIPYPASGIYTVQFKVQLYDGTVAMWDNPQRL